MKNLFRFSLFFFAAFILVSCQSTKHEVKVTGHRGASGFAPENTIASMKKAIEFGADFSELDVQETADGQLVLLHDGSLDRTTDTTGNIWEMNYADLKDVDAGSWFSAEYAGEPIPTLAAVIDTVHGKMKLNIELKMNGHQKQLTEKVVNLVTKKNFIPQCILTSFDRDAVRKVKALNNRIKTGYIFSKMPDEDIYTAEFDLLSVNKKLVTKEMVEKAHKNGKEVHVWTVNEAGDMKKLIQLGVDNIITNYPNRLLKILGR